MPADSRYAASPSAPPKPPMRSSPAGCRGARVRPASDVITLTPARAASASASCRASPVPPRIKTRLESGTADHLASAIYDDDLDDGAAVERGESLGACLGGDEIAQGGAR